MNLRIVLLTFLVLASVGCASYQGKVRSARQDLAYGDAKTAVEKLKPHAFENTRDQLVYLMDYGLATHLAGDYEESNRALLMADELAEYQDYHSVTKITESLLLSEEMVQYKGEPYENLLIHVYLAKNFILLGNYDNAMVSARKINEIMEAYRIDDESFESQNALAHYFAALLWESQKEYDSAVIEYEKAYKISPLNPQFQKDVLRANYLAQRMERYKELKKTFAVYDEPEKWKQRRDRGEIVVLYTQGWAPRKSPHPNSPRLPMLRPQHSSIRSAQLKIEGETYESSEIYSVENVAMNTLAKQYDDLVAKRLAGVVTKAVVSDQIRQKNKLLGDLAWIAMNVADRADVRQWSTLPETFQIIRVAKKPGSYQVSLEGLSNSGVPIASKSEKVDVVRGKTSFVVWRTF